MARINLSKKLKENLYSSFMIQHFGHGYDDRQTPRGWDKFEDIPYEEMTSHITKLLNNLMNNQFKCPECKNELFIDAQNFKLRKKYW